MWMTNTRPHVPQRQSRRGPDSWGQPGLPLSWSSPWTSHHRLILGYDRTGNFPLLKLLFVGYSLLPFLCVTVRRLHDTGRSGEWILLLLVPFVGWLVLLYFMVLKGDDGPNLYGPSPKP
jgi:hypothetical protein